MNDLCSSSYPEPFPNSACNAPRALARPSVISRLARLRDGILLGVTRVLLVSQVCQRRLIGKV